MNKSVTLEIEGVGQVLFERSIKAKHLNISVKPFKGVRVAVPKGLSFKKAENVVRSKVEWIKRHKQLPDRSSPLPSLRIPESVPLLIKLLKVSYHPDFIQDDFHRLDRIVLESLSAIALESDDNYIKVKAAITDFINRYTDTIKNLNFLYIFLDNIEHKYYTNKSPKMDIDDVVKKLGII